MVERAGGMYARHLDHTIFVSIENRTDPYCYNAVTPKRTCIVNAYCQFSQQACTNFMQTYLYLLISTHFFILTTNLHWRICYCIMPPKFLDLLPPLLVIRTMYTGAWSTRWLQSLYEFAFEQLSNL